MMCGRPTVAIDDGGLAPMLGLGGSTVPHDDPTALAGACAALLASPERRRQTSQAAGQRARNLFGLRMVVDRYREAYEDAAADSAGPTGHLTAVTPALAADLALS
jgi:glycosyltransferase involved in cell wall biosynthesis